MGRKQVVNQRLAAELAEYRVAGLAEAVWAAIGAAAGRDTPAESEYPLLAYVLRPSPQLLTAWLLTPGRFVVFERAGGGDELTIAFPLTRVRRVVERRDGTGAIAVRVELDADQVVLSSEAQSVTTAEDAAEAAPGARFGETVATTTARFTYYEIVLAGDEELAPEREQLARFARKMRGAIGL